MTCDVKPERNLKKAIARIGEAATGGATIVCLQELFAGQYFCQKEDAALFDLAEPIPGPTTQAIARSARKKHGVVVVGSLFERRAPGCITTRPSSSTPTARTSGMYRKMHIPDDPLYYEKFYFTPGDLGFKAFDTRSAAIGVLRVLGSVVSRRRRG